MNTSTPPPPSSGSMKYILGAIVAGLAMFGAYCAISGKSEDTKPPVEEAELISEKTKKTPDFDLAEEIIDSGVEDTAVVEEEVVKPKKRAANGGGWSCSGTLGRNLIAQEIKKRNREVRACYERALRTDNLLRGKLITKLKIEKSGKVSKVAISGLNNSDLRRCVSAKAKSWKFPSPTGGCTVVAAPFSLTPKN